VLVRTRARGDVAAAESRSWLLIKHRDDWAGDVDITTFAPRSVKSDGDFADILAQDNPDVWQSHRPANGGAAGKMLQQIIDQAAELKLKKSSRPKSKKKKPAKTRARAKKKA
jgi:hypothetical protein